MQETDPNHHKQRSEYIRNLIQRRSAQQFVTGQYRNSIPHSIVQFWHDLQHLPHDVSECITSWSRWKKDGFTHRIFDECGAERFIVGSLGERYGRAFERCYHPSMHADYFRLCYLQVEGGLYVDADDVCTTPNISQLFEDGRLKLQPLCYDAASNQMVPPSRFLDVDAYDPHWIFYFNNNPLIASKGHPIIKRALEQATCLLEEADKNALPEIQATTGPGNLSKSVFDYGMALQHDIEEDLLVLRDWDALAISRWPLSYRDDARNWRHSNRKKFIHTDG